MEKIYKKFVAIIASEKFFWGIVIFFIFQAAWIAISANSLPFDEQAHFGITRIYSHQWSPFFAHQPDGATLYGPVVRDPSYMYHYLMSFPLRVVAHFTDSTAIQLVSLRLITVLIFASGLVIFRKVLLATKLSRGLVHGVLLFFILIPVVPYVAANVNYDNLLFPMTGLALLFTIKVSEGIRKKEVHTDQWMYLLATCVFASLVKYPFLPIFVAIVVYLILQLYKAHLPLWNKRVYKKIAKSFLSYSSTLKVALGVLLLVSVGLFFERYGLNTLRYHAPNPQCDVVLSVDACKVYGPWARNYELAHSTEKTPESAVRDQARSIKTLTYPGYLGSWLNGMMITAFYVVKGGTAVLPMLLPWAAGVLVASFGAVLILFQYKTITKDKPILRFLFWTSVFYGVTLWLQNFSDYMHLGQGVGVQGRYLLPVLLLVLLLFAESIRATLKDFTLLRKYYVNLGVFLVLLFMMLQGGGAATYILKSNATWYWNERVIVSANQKAQSALNKLMLKAK